MTNAESWSPRLALLLILLTAGTAPLRATDFVQFVDASEELGGGAFGFERSALEARLTDTGRRLLTRVLESLDPVHGPTGAELSPLYSELEALRKHGSSRFVGGRGDRLVACVVHSANSEPAIEAREEARQSQIARDLKKLAGILGEFVPLAEREAPELTCAAFELAQDRASLRIEVMVGENRMESVVVTGRKEHLFLAVDLPVNKVEEIEYNDTLGRLETKQMPATFLLSVNYLFRDLASEAPQGPAAKVLLSASRRPLETFGLGVGWRFADLGRGDFKLGTFSPFVGYVWTSSDSVDGDGAPRRGSGREGTFVFGLSFNLDAGADWLRQSVAE